MKEAIIRILTDPDVRSDADVEGVLIQEATIASPWNSKEV
jgi:hypothetical protein